VFGAIAVAALSSGCRATPASSRSAAGSSTLRGGDLVVTIRAEPRSFNRLVARDTGADLVASLTQAKLIRINRVTDQVEPWLAEAWTRSEDGLRYTVRLRRGLSFSDGQPFTSADVTFSAEAAYAIPSAADALLVNGKRLAFTAPDPLTVAIAFPEPFAPGLRLLDNLWILPRHILQPALDRGQLASAWPVSASPADLVGLGPFVMTDHAPGQRIGFARNPHYWRADAAGTALPYLDRIVVDVVPDENTELLRLQSGQSDMTSSEMPPEAYSTMKRAADEGAVHLFDVGVGYESDTFWLNLKPGAFGSDPRAAWLQRVELRRAISMAVDRQLFADTVYLGAAVPVFGPITPANRTWYDAQAREAGYDPPRAKALLASIGLTDRNGDGLLEDEQGRVARFTLMTQKGRPSLERGVSVVRDELRKIGLVVDTAMLDATAVIDRIGSGNYEAVYFHPFLTDTDPALSMDFWLSSGSAHFWNLGQETPATDWERRIDDLMVRQARALDATERKRLFDEVQSLFADEAPAIYFAAPRVFAAASIRVVNVMPAIRRPQLLWSPDTIAVKGR
jgi:peptide/nickel transport system substrate-binding protein